MPARSSRLVRAVGGVAICALIVAIGFGLGLVGVAIGQVLPVIERTIQLIFMLALSLIFGGALIEILPGLWRSVVLWWGKTHSAGEWTAAAGFALLVGILVAFVLVAWAVSIWSIVRGPQRLEDGDE